jgi:hypothetical protein
MLTILRFVAKVVCQPLKPHRASLQSPPHAAFDFPMRFSEILAASSIPDFAALPLELWPGYRSSAPTNELREEPFCSSSATAEPNDRSSDSSNT